MDGSITQSIRIDTSLTTGDLIAFHGWEGRPNHSSWSFRTPYYRITLAKPINVHADDVYLPDVKNKLLVGDPLLDKLAEKDGIKPATGEELLRVLHAMHGPGILHGKVLRWEPIEEEKKPVMVTPEQMIQVAQTTIAVCSIMPFDFKRKDPGIAPLAVPVLKAQPLKPDPMLDQVVNHFLKVRMLSKFGREQQRRDIPAASQ
jgi:hypothetical protein